MTAWRAMARQEAPHPAVSWVRHGRTTEGMADMSGLDWLFDPNLILFHGSRGGIRGRITLPERTNGDFGRGFYMGTNVLQTKSLVISDISPVSYTMSLDLSDMLPGDVLTIDGRAWAYTVLHNRRTCAEFNDTPLDKAVGRILEGFEFVVGPIADDRMNEAMRRFSAGVLTDEGLFACLSRVWAGTQVVARTQEACDRITILTEQTIYEDEADDIYEYVRRHRKESRMSVDEVQAAYRDRGRYVYELARDSQEVDRLSVPHARACILSFDTLDGMAPAGEEGPAPGRHARVR